MQDTHSDDLVKRRQTPSWSTKKQSNMSVRIPLNLNTIAEDENEQQHSTLSKQQPGAFKFSPRPDLHRHSAGRLVGIEAIDKRRFDDAGEIDGMADGDGVAGVSPSNLSGSNASVDELDEDRYQTNNRPDLIFPLQFIPQTDRDDSDVEADGHGSNGSRLQNDQDAYGYRATVEDESDEKDNKTKIYKKRTTLAEDARVIRMKMSSHVKKLKFRHEPGSIDPHSSYALCVCWMKFTQFKNAYMCIMVNDIILSANLTLYAFISTFSYIYYVSPLVFFVLSTITYIAWRVQNERFTWVNTLYYWFRWLILLLVMVPFGNLLYRIIGVFSDRDNVARVSGQLSEAEKLFLSLVSLNNIYILIGLCGIAVIYTVFNLFWCCIMRKILMDAKHYQKKVKKIIAENVQKHEKNREKWDIKSDRSLKIYNINSEGPEVSEFESNASRFLRKHDLSQNSSSRPPIRILKSDRHIPLI